MFGYVTEEQFKIFMKQWKKVEKEGSSSNIFESCQTLANTKNLVPLMYSSGFEDVKERYRVKKIKITNKTVCSRYILLAVKQDYRQLFERFDEWRLTLNFDDWQKVKPVLSSGQLHAGPFFSALDRTYFNYWMLEFKYKPCNDNQNRQMVMDPPWLFTMWDDLIKHIVRK